MAAFCSAALRVPPGPPLLAMSVDGWPLYLALALVGLAALLAACWHWPILFLHGWPIRLFCRLFYPVRAIGVENVPLKGPALLVCNHVSYLDWVVVLAACPRYVRWVIFASWLRRFGLGHFVRRGRVIAIDAWGGPKSIRGSLTAAAEALAAGDVVGIFAEARFTRTGHLLPFHRGLERILEQYPAPVIPVYLDGLWGSVWSFFGGKLFWKWPRRFRPRALVAFGKPLPPDTPAPVVRQAVQKLGADCSAERARTALPVHRQFVRRAARHPFRPCMYDSTLDMHLSYARTLAAAWGLATLLRPVLGDEPMVGVWLPSSAGGAITNIALALLGKAAVNLNYTAPADAVRSAVRQCGIRHVLTSQRFLDPKPLDLGGSGAELVVLDQYKPRFTLWMRLSRFLAAVLLPGWVLDRWLLGLGGHTTADLATVIFSSGSTGEPKGVMLTHANVAANAASVLDVVEVTARDRLLGILPFFHSFGYTVTLWVPLVAGASLVYHADPRQAKKIGELCRKHRCTIFLATPTFLRFCLRQCDPADFATLRLLICGAEKLPQPLACDFHRKFGVLPLEGYGCTETSPVAATN
ncbi:MAG TPA: AMP-binding protein, partial [Gemmataceae bacterium]|nr:AMP-binding protein [Gemmataceae bacterium]